MSKDTHSGLNLNGTDEARIIALKVKKASAGLQESEKEELKQLIAKGVNPNKQ